MNRRSISLLALAVGAILTLTLWPRAPSIPDPEPLPVFSDPRSAACVRVLGGIVEAQCRDGAEPWAAAHGAIARGRGWRLHDGRHALAAAVLDHATRADGERWTFPAFREGTPIEPHPGLISKIILELAEPLEDRALQRLGITPARLGRDALAALDLKGDLWNMEWLLDILLRIGPDDQARAAAALALARLEAEQRHFEPLLEDPENTIRSYEKKSKMEGGRVVPDGIHRFPCGGIHLFQTVSLAAARSLLPPDSSDRFAKQWRILLFRGRAEALYWDRKEDELNKSAAPPNQRLELRDIFLSQRIKILGHALESAQKVRLWRAAPITPRDERDIEVIRRALEDAVLRAEEVGLVARIPELGRDPKKAQLYRDLVGDAGHALYGLRLARQGL